MDVNRVRRLMKKGLKKPHRVPIYAYGRLRPESSIGPNWMFKDGFVTFTEGGFVSSPNNRAEFSSKLYREVSTIQRTLRDEYRQGQRALEIGCGYGRLTPWVAEFVNEMYGADLNEQAIAKASEQHPQINFRVSRADSLPYDDDYFDLIFAWTVLQHIPPEHIENTCKEISRVASDDATILICERTDGEGENTWARAAEEYRRMLNRDGIAVRENKPVEPTFSSEVTNELLLLKSSDS